jgi:hypothetical protein
MPLPDYIPKIGIDLDGDFLIQGAQLLVRLAIELEVEQMIGAGRYERTEGRKSYGDGHQERFWERRVGGHHCISQNSLKAPTCQSHSRRNMSSQHKQIALDCPPKRVNSLEA